MRLGLVAQQLREDLGKVVVPPSPVTVDSAHPHLSDEDCFCVMAPDEDTRVRRKESLTEIHQSALTDNVTSKNHTIDWEGVRLPAKEPVGRRAG